MANFKDSVFTSSYERNGNTYYATFHPEVVVSNDAHDTTGRFFVVLLHPDKGLQSFYLNYDNQNNSWQTNENSGEIVEDELVKWCGEQIDNNKKQQ